MMLLLLLLLLPSMMLLLLLLQASLASSLPAAQPAGSQGLASASGSQVNLETLNLKPLVRALQSSILPWTLVCIHMYGKAASRVYVPAL
jgi:hypothetical protein